MAAGSKQKKSVVRVQRVGRAKQGSSTIDVISTPDLRKSPDLPRLGAHAYLVARDAVTNLAEGLSTRSSLAFLSVKECESELDEIDRYVDERIADELSTATPEKARELLACLKFVLDLERIGDLVLTIVGRARAYADRLSNDDRHDLREMCQILEQMLTLVHEANAKRNVQPARTALRLDGEMDRLRTRIYSRQINRRQRDLALSLEVFSMAQALERQGTTRKTLPRKSVTSSKGVPCVTSGRSGRCDSSRSFEKAGSRRNVMTIDAAAPPPTGGDSVTAPGCVGLMPSRVCRGDRIRQRLAARPNSRGSFANHAIASSAQIFEDSLSIARVVRCKARQRESHDVVVMQLIHTRLAASVEPQPVHEHHVFGLQIGIVRTDPEAPHFWTRQNNLKHKLMFWRQSTFPSRSHAKGLLFGRHFCREPCDNAGGTKRICRLHNRGKHVACRDDHQ